MKVINLKMTLMAVAFAALATACKDDASKPKTYTYTTDTNWNCGGNFCQDVWEVYLVKGTKASFAISNLTDGSVGQIALYAPGVEPGGTNLFTESENELSCTDISDCDNGFSGVSVEFTVKTTGTYKFAATRNNNESCGSSGNYSLEIISNTEIPTQVLNDAASAAPQDAVCI